MMKSISLNAKVDKIIKINEMKSEYRDAADVKVEEIVTSINMIINNIENE